LWHSSGFLLGELKNDIMRETPVSFELIIDPVVTKIQMRRTSRNE